MNARTCHLNECPNDLCNVSAICVRNTGMAHELKFNFHNSNFYYELLYKSLV